MLAIGFIMFDVMFMLVFFVVFFGIFGSVIYRMIKGVKTTSQVTRTIIDTTRADSQSGKYSTINSHYSQETLNGTRGQGPAGDSTPIQPVYNGTFRTDYAVNEDHNHAYEHKVEPIEEATVHELFEERKQAYRERKAEMKADLPKTSYSEVEAKVKKSSSKYRDVQGVFAKNGDNGAMVAGNEMLISCDYCGAKNIVPRSRSTAYKCYFCRQEV
ncbi:MAG: hypothetical protein IJV71_00465 [Lachnospiraceae bacterium]|nr:hypothetical protein [Lachnospiraceae bacterium]